MYQVYRNQNLLVQFVRIQTTQLQIVPNRFMRTRDALILDPEYAALAYLRPFQTNDIAKVGDAEKKQILAEVTLEVRNEAAHGGVFDLS